MRSAADCPELPTNYKIITIISIALAIQTISFFIYLNLQAKLYKWLIIFIPFISGTCISKVFLNATWSWSLLSTLFVTIFYQRCYILIMRNMPRSFTYGEASILVQGVLLFAINSVLILNGRLCETSEPLYGDLPHLNIIMMVSHINSYKMYFCFVIPFVHLSLQSALLWLLIVCVLLAVFKGLRKPALFYTLMAVFVLAATLTPVTQPLPITFVFEYLLRDNKRVRIIHSICACFFGSH